MRFLSIFFLFISFVYAVDTSKIVLDTYISKDEKDFVNIKNIHLEEVKPKDFLDFKLKVILDEEVLKQEPLYMRINHGFNHIKEVNLEAKKYDNETLIKLDNMTANEVILHVDTKKYKTAPFVQIDIFNEDELNDIIRYESLFYGLCYGIIFCAALYNFVLFVYNRHKAFLFYSLLQVSALMMLLTKVFTPDFLKPLYEYVWLSDLFGDLAIVFAILFNQTFLDTKRVIPLFNKILNAVLAINLIDITIFIFTGEYFFTSFIPISAVLLLLLISALIVFFKGHKETIFYIVAWGFLFVSVVFLEYEIVMLPEIYTLHLVLPIESLILSFSLGYKMRELKKEKNQQTQMLIHQNKLASMGEMINNIAHQYRQPLTNIGYILMNINSAYEHKELDKKYLDKKINQANSQLEFLSKTIEVFRTFYKPKDIKEKFFISSAVEKTVNIISPVLNENNIKLEVIKDEDFEILGYENEYSQVLLNLLSNAKDILLLNEIKESKITLTLEKQKGKTLLKVKDNARGVKKEIEDKIFDAYFTTKDKSSGIGLYMSSMIIQEHFDGRLYLLNSLNGATFVIEV